MEINFKLKSHDYRILKSAILLYKKLGEAFQFEMKGPIFFKKKKKTFVFLRSPHVNKASREHFKFITHSCLIVLKKEKLSEEKLDFFIKKSKILNIPGVSVKMTRKYL